MSGLPNARSITSSPARRNSIFSASIWANAYGGNALMRRNSTTGGYPCRLGRRGRLPVPACRAGGLALKAPFASRSAPRRWSSDRVACSPPRPRSEEDNDGDNRRECLRSGNAIWSQDGPNEPAIEHRRRSGTFARLQRRAAVARHRADELGLDSRTAAELAMHARALNFVRAAIAEGALHIAR